MDKQFIVVIGSSTGGTRGIEMILESLPKDFSASILIVQHMPETFTPLFADRLDRLSQLPVTEAKAGEEIRPGAVYLAPGNYHMEVDLKGLQNLDQKIIVVQGPNVRGFRPSIDVLMKSVAHIYKNRTIGVLLSGMGVDGVEGITAIHQSGGITIAQDERTSAVFGMAKRAIERGSIDKVLPIDEIASEIMKQVK